MKKFFKRLVYILDSKLVWRVFFHINVVRLKLGLYVWNKKWKFKYLNSEIFSNNADSSLFILGSGSSSEKISGNQWEEVKSNFSIGLNLWLVHDFNPSAYAFELDKFVPDQYFEDRARILKSKINKGFKPLIFLLPRGIKRNKLPIPNELYSSTYIYSNAPTLAHLVSFSKDAIKSSISMTSGAKTGWPAVFGDGASIERMVSIGIKNRFKNIILVGVDLNDITCFYDINKKYFEKHDFSLPDDPRKHLEVHKTMDRSIKKVTVVDTIPLMAEYAKSLGINLYIESGSSELAKFLPVYKWTIKE
mgnify:CR=1 FL=1